MELIQLIWIFIFFLFALVLIFTWSKIAVISGKIKSITAYMKEMDLPAVDEPEDEADAQRAAKAQPAKTGT